MQLLALVPSLYDTSPGQRFRMEQWEPWLRAWGVQVTFEAFENETLHQLLYKPGHRARKLGLVAGASLRRLTRLRALRDYDAVYIFREAALLGPPVLERWIYRQNMPFIFDFDDPIFVPYKSPANGYLSRLKCPAKTRTICRLATYVMTGNPYLASYARRVSDRVSIVPTTIDMARYTIEEPKLTSDPPIMGWSGSYSTIPYLDGLAGALQRLARQERFRLRSLARHDITSTASRSTPCHGVPKPKWLTYVLSISG